MSGFLMTEHSEYCGVIEPPLRRFKQMRTFELLVAEPRATSI